MKSTFTAVSVLLVLVTAGFCAPIRAGAQSVPSIRKVQVLRGQGQVEIEIETSARIVPQANVLTGPDRLIIDFVNAKPALPLRSQPVNRREVKSLRVGLFSSDPPVTRIVMDLNGPQPYQVFPSGKTVIVKVGANGAAETVATRATSVPVLVNTAYPRPAVQTPVPVKPSLEVLFRNGLLSIRSNKASLSEVLFEVQQRTGAEIAIPAGAEQEKVVIDLGPAPAAEVLARLLNGSNFNFMILNSSTDSRALDRVILSPRAGGAISAPGPQATSGVGEADQAEVQSQEGPPIRSAPPGQSAEGVVPPAGVPEAKAPDGEVPD